MDEKIPVVPDPETVRIPLVPTIPVPIPVPDAASKAYKIKRLWQEIKKEIINLQNAPSTFPSINFV